MGRSARRTAKTQTFDWKSNIVGTFLHAHRLHKTLVDFYIYPVLEGLAEISSTLVRVLTFTPALPKVGFLGGCTIAQARIIAPLANMDNYDANVQIYDTAKYLEIYCFCSQGKYE